jgi:hypothetical protein
MRGHITVLAGVLVHLTLGTLYCFGNLSPYLVSFLRAHGHDSIRLVDASQIFAAATAGQGVAMFFGGLIEQAIGPRWTVLLGGWVMTQGATDRGFRGLT